MGIFEKSIPRYVYNPIQRQPEAVPEYYVDDIFDPILNRNVRTALTQKYGNPLLGTVMGYYEGVENALFGQDDKWGILGPGMGILSGFGRSMDKAGDVILGTLTESVKGVTGQGFENPLENIFVEDQDYTGKRALAAMANSMRGLAGGTTVTEEDFGRGWGLPSLGIELATDPSILGGNLTKIANTPKFAKRLGSVSGPVGKAGEFLQQYDDIMAKAAIDLTAPGLRPGIKALKGKLAHLIPRNHAADYVDYIKTIYETDPTNPESIKVSKAAQQELANNPEVQTIVETYNQLEDLQKRVGYTPERELTEQELLRRVANFIPQASEVPDLSLEAAERFVKRIRDAITVDLDYMSKLDDMLQHGQQHLKETISDEILERDFTMKRNWSVALHRAERLIRENGGKVYDDVVKTPGISEVYEKILREIYPDIPADFVFTPGVKNVYDEIAARNPAFKEYVVNNYLDDYFKYENGALIDESEGVLNKYYVDDLDFSPNAWRYGTFSENDALNKQITNAITGKARRRKLEQYFTISPSEIGKLTPEVVDLGNQYAENVFAHAFTKHSQNGSLPAIDFNDPKAFKELIDSEDFNKALDALIPDNATTRKHFKDTLYRALYPPKKSFGKDYTLRHRFNDFKELQKILNGWDVNQDLLNSSLEDISSVYSTDLYETLFTHPWRGVTNRTDDELSQYLSKTYADTDVGLVRSALNGRHNAKKFDEFFKEYTIGSNRNIPLTYEAFVARFGDISPEDYSAVAKAIDDFRLQMAGVRSTMLNLTAPEMSLVFRDIRDGLNQFNKDIVEPAVQIDDTRYVLDNLSLNKTVSGGDGDYDGDSGNVQYAERIAGSTLQGDIVRPEIAVRNTSKKQSSVEDSYLWVLRDLLGRNAEIFKDPEKLRYVYEPISPYVQLKIKTPIDGIERSVVERFKKDVLPEVQKALDAHQIPFRKDADFKKAYPKLYAALHTSKDASDNMAILNFIKTGFGGDGFTGFSHDIAYHNFYINNPDIVSKFKLPKKFDAKAYENVNAMYKLYVDKAMEKGMSFEDAVTSFAGTPVGELLSEFQTENLFKGSVDLAALDSDSLIAHLQSRQFRQTNKDFELAQSRAQFGNMFFGSKYTNVADEVVGVSDEIKNLPKVPKSQQFTATAENANSVIINAPDETAAEMISNPPTAASNVIEATAGPTASIANPKHQMFEEDPEQTVTEKVWSWFEQIRKAMAVRSASMGLLKDEATGEYVGRATLRTKRNLDLFTRARSLKLEEGITPNAVRNVYGLLAAQEGDILRGVDFVDSICRDGVVRSAFKTKAASDAAASSLRANVNTFNSVVGSDVVTLLERKMTNGNYEVIVHLNTKDKKIVPKIEKAYKKLSKATFGDTVFMPAHKLTTEQLEFLASDRARKIREYLDEIDASAKEQSRMLGFAYDDSASHMKHVRNVDPNVADYVANNLNNGIDLDGIDEVTTLLSNTDSFRPRFKGVFGTQLKGRRYRGAYWNYDAKDVDIFTYDLEKIAKGSLGDGVFANSNYQSFVDLFVNDNFKIQGIFNDVDDIRKFLYSGGAEGKFSGNLKNVDLCTAKFDANGRIVGIHKYDVYSDADLAKALKNKDTILVPANVVDTLDKVLRKEIRLSNKAYAFINKHFTIPFKFGVLTNPGFLVGNLSDAYTKQAVSMSEKYGTSVSEELAKVGKASAMYLNLGNSFNAAIEKWKKHMKDAGIQLSAAEEIPEILAGHAPSRKRLMEYIQGTLKDSKGEIVYSNLTTEEEGVIMLWTKLQQIQHTSNSLREFDDLADGIGKSEFVTSRNIVDRVFQGAGKYSGRKPSTWGVFINNPIANNAMKASELIENTMRGTAILNDLMHQGYDNETIFKMLLEPTRSPEMYAAKLNFEADYASAINAMYESNFNYERMSDFMEGVGKAMPFPTFFLKNLAYWLELFEKNPQFFDHAITVHESMWQSRDTSEDEILAEAKGRGAVPVGQKLSKFFKGIYKPTPLQSMFGAFNLINEPVENLSYRLHPLISGSAQAVNQALPHSPLTTFLGEAKYRPYSTDMYERNVKQDDENFNSLAYTVHRSNPFERTINTALRTPAKVREGQAQLSDFLPSVFQPDFSKK